MTSPGHIATQRVGSAAQFGARFDVSRETMARLETYASLLAQWQKTINLIAPATLDEVWHRHMADSAQLAALVPHDARRLLDIGSGGGFPGLVLAILLASRPGFHATLIESDSRKAAFLSEVSRRTGAPVDILCMRIESSATRARVGKVDVITARALAPMAKLLALSEPFFSPGTLALFLKGRDAAREIDEAVKAGWRCKWRLVESSTEPEARIVVMEELAGQHGGPKP